MKVIFKHDVGRVGKKNDIKEVPNGYAQNYLIPNGLAVIATASAEKELAKIKTTEEAEKKIQDSLLQKNLKAVSSASLKITAKVNEKGHLFSAIHKEQIISELRAQAKLELKPDLIYLEKPIKEIGMHQVKVGAGGNTAILTVEVVGE